MENYSSVRQLARKRPRPWLCITSIIWMRGWKCSPPVTLRPSRWPLAFLTESGLCLAISLGRWRYFSLRHKMARRRASYSNRDKQKSVSSRSSTRQRGRRGTSHKLRGSHTVNCVIKASTVRSFGRRSDLRMTRVHPSAASLHRDSLRLSRTR